MKIKRQSKIIDLINEYDIETQEELLSMLHKAGFNVTQATISRDIRELKLTKVNEGGKQVYRMFNQNDPDFSEKFIQILKSGYIYMEAAQNILVIKTVSGMAMAVAAAIDSMNIPGIVGCIAGDDTILCAIKSTEEVPNVIERINKLINSKTN